MEKSLKRYMHQPKTSYLLKWTQMHRIVITPFGTASSSSIERPLGLLDAYKLIGANIIMGYRDKVGYLRGVE